MNAPGCGLGSHGCGQIQGLPQSVRPRMTDGGGGANQPSIWLARALGRISRCGCTAPPVTPASPLARSALSAGRLSGATVLCCRVLTASVSPCLQARRMTDAQAASATAAEQGGAERPRRATAAVWTVARSGPAFVGHRAAAASGGGARESARDGDVQRWRVAAGDRRAQAAPGMRRRTAARGDARRRRRRGLWRVRAARRS